MILQQQDMSSQGSHFSPGNSNLDLRAFGIMWQSTRIYPTCSHTRTATYANHE